MARTAKLYTAECVPADLRHQFRASGSHREISMAGPLRASQGPQPRRHGRGKPVSIAKPIQSCMVRLYSTSALSAAKRSRASAVTFSSISASEGMSVIGAALVILMLVGAGRWWALW